MCENTVTGDLADFQEMTGLREFFPQHPPARTTIQVPVWLGKCPWKSHAIAVKKEWHA